MTRRDWERQQERERLRALLCPPREGAQGDQAQQRNYANDNLVIGHAATIGPIKSAER